MKKKRVIIIICLIIIILMFIAFMLWSLFRPAKQLTNKLNKINNTTYNLEKTNAAYASYGNCKVSVYPTTNLMEPNLI